MLRTNLAIVQPQRAARVGEPLFPRIMVCRKVHGFAVGLHRAKMSPIPTNPAGVLDVHNSLFREWSTKRPGLTPGPASSKKLLLKPPPAPRGDVAPYHSTFEPQPPPELQPVSRPKLSSAVHTIARSDFNRPTTRHHRPRVRRVVVFAAPARAGRAVSRWWGSRGRRGRRWERRSSRPDAKGPSRSR